MSQGDRGNEGHTGRTLPGKRGVSLAFVSVVALVSLFFPVFSSRASAEIVFFNTGRTLSVKSHRADGESLVLVMRGGGEIVCEASIISRFAPDEVPYPEPEVEAVPASVQEAGVLGPYSEIIDPVAAGTDVPAQRVPPDLAVESAYNLPPPARKAT